jgi:pyruvate/2-oxoacid:ferredoxin oxidoreductase beta subunit
LHEHNLYTGGNGNERKFVDFANDLMEHLKIEHDIKGAELVKVHRRCEQFVKNHSQTWLRWGLLTERNGTRQRTTAFEEALGVRRRQWIEEVRGPSPDTAAGGSSFEENPSEEMNSRKRVRYPCITLSLHSFILTLM